MLPYGDSKLMRFALYAFFAVILVYGLYEAQGLLFGPKIQVSTEKTVVHDPYVKIEGQAERVVTLSISDKQYPVTKTGKFSEPYLLASGDNQITLEAKDPYGRITSRTV